MEKTIFAKKRTASDGRTFYTYLTKLHKKSTDEDITVQVRFRDECGVPKTFPCNIILNDGDSNYSEKTTEYTDKETGEIKTVITRTLWVNNWSAGADYVDNSMSDFE